MDKAWWDRWSPATGIVFVVLLIVGFVVIGDFPTLGDPAEEFAAFYEEERGRILAGSIILALSLFAFVWWIAALAGRVRGLGEPRLTATIVAGGTTFAAMTLAVIGMHAGLAHSAAEEVGPEVVKGLDALATGVDLLSALPFAALVLAFGVAVLRSGFLAAWFGYASLAAALVFVLGATTWAREGFWAPYGGFGWIVIVVFVVWVLAASALLLSRPPAVEHPLTSVPQAGRPGSSPTPPTTP